MLNKKSLIFLIVGLISVLIVGCASEGGDAPENTGEGNNVDGNEVVATVNGNNIDRSEYEYILEMMMASYEQQGVDFEGEEGEAFLGQIQTQAINSLVQEEVLLQEAEAEGFEASEEVINEQLEATKSQFPSEEQFEAQLEMEELTEADLKDMLAKEITIGQFLQSNVEEVTVSDEELEAAYEQYVGQMEELTDQAGEDAEAPEIPEFEDIKGQLEMQLSQQNQQMQMSQLIEELMAENEVEIFI